MASFNETKKQPTVLQMDIVGLWANGVNNKGIAETLNCSEETIRKVKKDEELKKIYYERQREQIVELLPIAIKRLRDILRDDCIQATAQIAAIREVFERSHLKELMDNTDKEIKITVSYE